MSDAGPTRILLIVPTLGQRNEYLAECLASIRGQDVSSDIVVVRPQGDEAVEALARRFDAEPLDDVGSLPGSINEGVNRKWRGHDFVTWLGDDDLLEPGSFSRVCQALDAQPGASVAFGHCRYIDESGKPLWVSKAGRLAPALLSWGPDLVPQPGMLVRSHAWHEVGGLDESYRYAFDLDLLLRLKKVGRLVPVNHVVSSFRWHAQSLTVSDRTTNLSESERAKRSHLPAAMRPLAPIWEFPVRWATRAAAQRVSGRAGA